ncbi:MAG: hypothetical protein QOG80_3277, partial [Pseudonocardiales bacterium]|nr:hypothetical protein [Pseudonocardiales bacterium]
MTFDHEILSKKKLTAFVSAGIAAIVFTIGGFAIADASSSSAGSTTANAATSSNAATVIPFQRGVQGSS